MTTPLLVRDAASLGMKLPPPQTFSVAQIAELLGDDFPLEVIEVAARARACVWVRVRVCVCACVCSLCSVLSVCAGVCSVCAR
jgi:hypothetical protein